MGFNEIRRNLEDAGTRDARIRELAESLHRRGLAMTKESARQLAESMVATERKVQQHYQERKERTTVYNDPRSKETDVPLTNKPASYFHTVEDNQELGRTAPESVLEDSPERSPRMKVSEAIREPDADADALIDGDTEEADDVETQDADDSRDYVMLEAKETDHATEPGDDELGGSSRSDEEVAVKAEEAIQPEEAARPADEDLRAAPGSVPTSVETFEDDAREGIAGSEGQLSEEAAEEAEKPAHRADEREDLGKKHNIDLSKMFDVNK